GLGPCSGNGGRTLGPPRERAGRRPDAGPAGTPGDLECRLDGLGTGVGEEHRPRPAGPREQPLRERGGRRGRIQVGDVAEGRDLPAHRGHHRRVGAAERVDRDPAQQVQIRPAVLVHHGRTLAADQGQRRRPVGVHAASGPAVHQAHDGTTIVPNPSSVNTSSSIECGTRPSTTCAAGTPPLTARRQASIFGTIPASRVGSNSASSVPVSRVIRLVVSGQSAYRPSTSVSITSLRAATATARAAAAVSALTVCSTPSASGATVDTTGMRPAATRSVIAEALTCATSPTWPTSTGSPST